MSDSGHLILVDGHNLILGQPELKKLHTQNSAAAREGLVDWLSRFQATSDSAVMVVFDGKGAERSASGGDEGEVLVMYSRSGETADSVIERIALNQAGKRRVTVVSNDVMIHQMVNSSGVQSLSIRQFCDLVEEGLDDFRRSWNVS